MTATANPAEEVVELLRQLHLPHMRKTAPELLATAKAQRWEPAEALRALLADELAGRKRSSVAIRRRAANFPTGKTFESWDDATSSVATPTLRSLRTLEWVSRHENLVVCGPSGRGQHCAVLSFGLLKQSNGRPRDTDTQAFPLPLAHVHGL